MAVAVLVAATIAGAVWKRRQGRLRAVGPVPGGGAAGVTLLLFTTPSCTTCRRVRELCATIDHVHYQEIDASADLDRVRAFGVWRAPTLFVLDAAGTPIWRANGVPRRADLLAAVTP